MNSKSIIIVLFLAFIGIFYSSCNNDTVIRNQLTGGIWNVEQFELREYSANNLLSEQIIFDFGEYIFFDDGTGEYFEYGSGFLQNFVWNTDGFELVIVINNQPIVYEVLQNGADFQVWRTYIDYGPDDYDEIVMRLFRF